MFHLTAEDKAEVVAKCDRHDVQIREVFEAVRALMEPPPGIAKRRIGFQPLPDDEM